MSKHIVHCWADGPLTEDGCPTTCMLENNHAEPHEWSRDDEIIIRFAPLLKTGDPA